MKVIPNVGKTLVLSCALAAMVFGTIALTAQSADAKPPGLLCGPTYLWNCTGGKGPPVIFPGTICEKMLFELKTGKTCGPLF